jgi:choline dehydrogenase-like flavoprotein
MQNDIDKRLIIPHSEDDARHPDDLVAPGPNNQQKLAAELKPHYDSIVCGSGSCIAAPAIGASINPAARDQISIAGAGPAGLACAVVLARAGRRVVVHEHQNRVGARFHGDFQGLDNWTGDSDVMDELSSQGIHVNFECHPVHEGIAYDAWGKSYPYSSSAPIYYLVRRGNDDGTLDHGFLQQALEAGVEVRFGQRYPSDETCVVSSGPRAADVNRHVRTAVPYLRGRLVSDCQFSLTT